MVATIAGAWVRDPAQAGPTYIGPGTDSSTLTADQLRQMSNPALWPAGQVPAGAVPPATGTGGGVSSADLAAALAAERQTAAATYAAKGEVPARVGSALYSGGLVTKAGTYYGSGQQGAAQSQAAAGNRLYLTPFWGKGRRFDRICLNVLIAGTAGHVARLGVYAAGPDEMPAGLLVDSGSAGFAVDAVVPREVPIDLTIPDLTWLAFTAQSGTFSSWSSTSLPAIIGAASLTTPNPVNYLYPTTSYAPTAALPATLAGATFTAAVGNVPAVFLRAA